MTLLRREALILIGAGLAGGAHDVDGRERRFRFRYTGGGPMPLSAYAGRPILVVNTATACGYAGSSPAFRRCGPASATAGLMVIGVPRPIRQPGAPGRSGHRGGRPEEPRRHLPADRQDPRADAGAARSTLGRSRSPAETPRWNFHKYLIARDGSLAAAFATQVEPTDPRVI